MLDCELSHTRAYPDRTMSDGVTAHGLHLQIVSVNVGQPQALGKVRGRTVKSGIGKRPVSGPTIYLAETNLDGDRQADLSVHGGPDKAVYAYPVEHLSPWSAELDLPVGPGFLGENLTVSGADESQICIGDVFRWDDATLQVTQPRSPCFKLALKAGRPDLPKRLTEHGWTGWYLRVLQPGEASTTGQLHRLSRGDGDVSVLDIHRALFASDVAATELEHALQAPGLSTRTRDRIARRLEDALGRPAP
ncbi:MAG: MOSC domain-containing protein [Chloroflexota bacterium]